MSELGSSSAAAMQENIHTEPLNPLLTCMEKKKKTVGSELLTLDCENNSLILIVLSHCYLWGI